MSLFAFENNEVSHQRKLFVFLDVDFFTTSRTWINLPMMAIVGIVIALIFEPVDRLILQILVGIGYGMLVVTSSLCHGLGHILSSRVANAPMKSLLLTATVGVTHYEDDGAQASRVHVGRSLGGPLLNLVLGMTSIAIYLFALDNHFLLFFGIVSLGFGAFTFLPIPSLDGSVILRELRNWKQ